MAAERTKAAPVGNVLYVEPNYVHSDDAYGSNGLEVYEFIPNLEDYSIFVNLEVEVIGRTINAENQKYVLSYVSSGDKESVNLMQGSKLPVGDGSYINSLTTNYTDLHINNMRKVGASTELFGINYIDIAYRNYTVPEVTIEFTDVRGAAVFGQRELYETERQEKAINNKYAISYISDGGKNDATDIQNTFFQCFFTFPYPKFKLLVKGFYGQPVSYELTCADFRARFNSDTGNFSCTAKFVGYMFSFLNDVMMNGLIAAPYSDFIGADYWGQQKFKLDAYDGGKCDTPKIAQLLKDLPQAINQAEHVSKSTPEVQEKRNIENIKSNIQKIERIYKLYTSSIVNLIKQPVADGDLKLLITNSDNNTIYNGAIILIESDDSSVPSENFSTYFKDNDGQLDRYDDLKILVNEFNDSYSNRNLPLPVDIRTQTPNHRLYPNENDRTKYIIDKYNYNDDIKNNCPELYNAFKRIVDNENTKSGEGVSRYSKYQWGYFYNDNNFYEIFKIVLEELNNREKEITKTLESSKKNALAEKLGFYPTVENITRIVMAHFETFAYMIFKTGQLIESENPKRTIKTLGIANDDDISDVPLSEKEKYIPPFPKFTEKVERDGMQNREESWIGVYGNKFREVDLVHGILNGVAEVAKLANAGEDSGGAGSESSLTTKMRHPLSPLDLIIEKEVYGSFDQNSPADLLSLVGLRAIQVISSPNFDGWNDHCDVLGRAEAENILATEKLSNELKKTITGKTSDTIVNMLKGQNVDNLKPSSGVWPWKNATDDTGIITDNGDFNICKVKTTKGDTVFTVPFQALEWGKIKQEVFSTKSAHSDDYFNVAPYNYSDSKKDNLFNIETNINRIKTIAESQMVNVDGIEFYRDKILSEATYNKDAYKKNMTSYASSHIASYISGAENLMPSPKSCMLPCTSSYVPNMELFAGGYDMDDFNKEHPGEGGKAFLGLFGNGWTDVSGNEVKRESASGFSEYLESPSTTKYTITEFPGINSRFEPYVKLDNGKNLVSLFGQELYYLQDNDYVKAFMFLCSLGGIYNYESIIENEICNKKKTISIIPLPAVLYAGGVIWANSNRNLFKYCEPFVDGSIISSANTNTKCINKLQNELNVSVISSLRGRFEYFVNNGVKGNSIMKSFNAIKNNLELRPTLNYEVFFNNLGEIEENGILSNDIDWYYTGIFKDKGYTRTITKEDGTTEVTGCLLKFLDGELGDSLFRNYIAIDEDKGGSTSDKTVGLRLGNRDGSLGVVDAVNVALAPCTFMKNTKFFYKDSPAKISVNEGNLKSFFDGFLNKLGEDTDDSSTDSSISQSDPTKTSVEIKIGIYRYCKLLYDKWIGGTKEGEFDKMWTVHSLFDDDDKYFHFIDSYYNKIGQRILLNIGNFCEQVESCYTSEQYSLLSFLSSIYAHNKFNLLCVQNFMDMQNLDNMKKMFDCVPYTSGWDVRQHPNFIVQYPYEPSSHLDYGDAYTNDGFMINEKDSDYNKWPEALKSRLADSKNDYQIPAFGVSYGKMYQSYFTDIDVSMDNPKVTEQSIKAQFAIACLNNPSGNTNDRSNGYTIGQDLFSIYSNNSYTCNVTMMGCAWVQPMMYFVLNNVPMFRGTYMVISVSHRIEQGSMVTKFTGIRMSNVCTRIAIDDMVRGEDSTEEGTENEEPTEEPSNEEEPNDDCEYPEYPVEPEEPVEAEVPSESEEPTEEEEQEEEPTQEEVSEEEKEVEEEHRTPRPIPEPSPEPTPTPPAPTSPPPPPPYTPPTPPPTPTPAPKPAPKKKEATPKIDNGGDYGEPNYSSLLNGTVGQAKGNSFKYAVHKNFWNSKNIHDALTAIVLAESDKTDLSIQAMAAMIYNRVKSKDGKFNMVINETQFSSWKDKNGRGQFNNHHSKWNYAKGVLKKIFTNGPCSVMVGKKFVTPDWNLDHNKNNKLFKLKRNTEYTLTAPQVSNFYYNGSRSEWYNGSKFVMIRKASCRLAAVIGTTGPQAICIDPDSVKKLTVGGTIDLENDTVIYNNSKKPSNTTPAKIINNGDNHISSLGTSFVDALNKSSKSSGINVEVGVDVAKSEGNVLYLQNRKDKNFGKIFDIIIRAYNDKVSLVKWVVPGDGSSQPLPPRYLIVVLKTNNTNGATKIKVVREDDVEELVSDITINKDGGMNKDFCQAIVKKYGNKKDLINKDLDPDLSDEKIKKLFELYDASACLAPSSTAASGSGKKSTTNSASEKPIKTSSWNLDAFIRQIHYWQKEVCNKHPERQLKDSAKRSKKSGSCRRCTGVLNRALQDVGYGMKYFKNTPWEVYSAMTATTSDFNEVDKGVCQSTTHFKFKNPPQKGDICLMWCTGRHSTKSKENNLHTCVFDGKNWVSDFIQSNCNVYTNKTIEVNGKSVKFICTMEWHVFRHK